MISLRRYVRRLWGRDPQRIPPPIPSLSPLNNPPTSAAAAAPPETQQAPSPCDAGQQSSHVSIASAENTATTGAHGPFAGSNQHVPATTGPDAVPTQRRTPTNSTATSGFTFRTTGRSDTDSTRRFTIRSFASQDLERTAKKKSRRIRTLRESYPIYNLKWESLRQWLNKKFPECQLGEAPVGPPVHHAFLFSSKTWRFQY
jgi:hypothetical protein